MEKNDDNIFNTNFCFSKVLKDIDFRMRFKSYKEEKSLYIYRQLKKEQRKKNILFNRRKEHNEIVHSLHKANEENKVILNYRAKKLQNNTNLSQINIYSTNNVFYLPKIEEQKNKDNKIIIFEKIWKEQILNNKKRNKGKRNNSNKTIYKINDIFDDNFEKTRREKEKKTEKRILLEKIKVNNLKVKKKLKMHQDIMAKFKDKREYSPNYKAIEKHLPEVNLKTKSQRIFPKQFIKLNNIGNLNYKEKKSESLPKKIIIKNYLNQSIMAKTLSSCTLFRNFQKGNDNSFIKRILNKNISIIK